MYNLPSYVSIALSRLKNSGFKAYAVGGCVRDIMLGNVPDDYDITTNALPEDIIRLFDHTVLTGIKHGTVTVIIDDIPMEITTFRADGTYTDHRKPDSVKFLSTIDGDLSRRDFTVNAMAYDGENEIIDLFSGKEDLKSGIIRAVGNPEERFTEDALRILRAIRFAAKLNFTIEENTKKAIIEKAPLLEKVSRERIFSEISKILISPNPQILEIITKCGGMEFLGINRKQSLCGLNSLKCELPIRFYALCQKAKIPAENLCKALKTDNALLKYCRELDLLFKLNETPSRAGIKRMLYYTSKRSVNDYLLLISQSNGNEYTDILKDVISSKEPYVIKDLAVTGTDIISHGFSGEKVGEILENLLFEVIENPECNTKEHLLKTLNNK